MYCIVLTVPPVSSTMRTHFCGPPGIAPFRGEIRKKEGGARGTSERHRQVVQQCQRIRLPRSRRWTGCIHSLQLNHHRGLQESAGGRQGGRSEERRVGKE